MPTTSSKCSKIRHIVRLRQMLKRWKTKATSSQTCRRIPSDVPSGHIAVSVGVNQTRFVVRASYLNHPVFQNLLNQAEEEFGFNSGYGPLAIPCDELVFEEILRSISRSGPKVSSARFHRNDPVRFCHVDMMNGQDYWTDSNSLLHHHTLSRKTTW